MDAWHIWIIAGFVLFIIEIFTSAFVIACFGLACIIAGLFSLLGIGVKLQILIFSVSSLLIFFKIRPFFIKYLSPSKNKTKTNVDALVGKTGRVTERIDPKMNLGRVIVQGDDWKGVSIDETVIEKGEKITVITVEGTKLLVKPIETNKAMT